MWRWSSDKKKASTGQRMPRLASNVRSWQKGLQSITFQRLQRELWTFYLPKCERVNSYCLQQPRLWHLATAAQRNKYTPQMWWYYHCVVQEMFIYMSPYISNILVHDFCVCVCAKQFSIWDLFHFIWCII